MFKWRNCVCLFTRNIAVLSFDCESYFPPCSHHLPLCHSTVIRAEHFYCWCHPLPFSNYTHQHRHVISIKAWQRMDNNNDNSDKYLFFSWGKVPQTNIDALFLYRSTIILNIWMYGCSKQVFPFDGPYSSPPLCCAQLAGLSVVTTSPFNAPDRGLFAPIYVFSPITPWQAGGCQATLLRCWWSPLWLVLPASCTIFFIFLDSIREEDSLICLSLVQSVV